MKSELEKMEAIVDKMSTAILVTRRADGHLVARPMARQKEAPGADFWFVTSDDSGKLLELENDPHVNVTFFKSGLKEWVSIAGIARVSRDPDVLRTLYAKDWRMWFPDEGDSRHGTPEDPRMVLIGVDVHSAVFLELDKPQPVVLFELVKGFVTGDAPDLGTMHHLSDSGPSEPPHPRM